MRRSICRLMSLVPFAVAHVVSAQQHPGFYRDPALHGETLLFTSEGDLWTVAPTGGTAHRLTSAAGTERRATISPDGGTVAFSADYEGPTEVYTMPVGGGLPARRTWDGHAEPAAWTPGGRLVVETGRYSTLPDPALVLVGAHGERERLPLATGAQAAYTADGRTLVFTRFAKQFSETKRYKGGWAESLWRWNGTGEAVPLTADYLGTSKMPMIAGDRLYFLSDRTGVMNVFSADLDGHDVKQVSHQKIFDVQAATMDGGRMVYSCAGELFALNPQTGEEKVIPVTLESDFDQMREHWVKKPTEYLTDVHVAPDGSSAVFTARGEVFTLPVRPGRVVKVAGESATRFRSARYMPDGKSIELVSTATGETEFWRYPANGVGKPEQWTHNDKVLRWDGVPSPDGHYLAHTDKDQQLWLYDIPAHTDKRIAQSVTGDFTNLAWSPDSRWLAFVESATNMFAQVKILNEGSGAITAVTSNRYNSTDPAWSADGKFLYLLSDRSLTTTVFAPWGPRAPEPHFARPVKLYELALEPGTRSPFLPPDELHPENPDADKDKPESKPDESKPSQPKVAEDKKKSKVEDKAEAKDKAGKPDASKADKKVPEVKIDLAGIESRLVEVPLPPGNLFNLATTEKRLCYMIGGDDPQPKSNLQCLDIANKGDEPDTVMSDVKNFEVSQDRKHILIGKGDDFFVVDADAKAAGLADPKTLGRDHIDLSRWTFSTTPRDEFRGIFLDAWRLERDYYYDRNMQGVNWPAMRDRYLPLVDRVADRDELNDVIAEMVSELSTLHTFVVGGDQRKPADDIHLATLGAELARDEKAGGMRVAHIYGHDPDLPNQAPPLARPESLVREGEVITAIDGTPTLSVMDERQLLRGKDGTPVLLHVKAVDGKERDVLVKPVSTREDGNLRYNEWEYTRRQSVESASQGHIGYVHLRAMGPQDIEQWAREYYPVFDREGLIIDVRHNNGGNIDSWLLADLLRKVWFYWQPRVGNPQWNMQYAFRGHIAVLCDQATASDGEAFTEGFKRFKMGTVLGTRTWGGEIWLSGSNVEADNGIATAAEMGVYGPEGKWLIEGHGVDPDQVVDNLPHATFTGADAQLEAALAVLKQQIAADPRPVPHAPPYPNKAFPN